MGYTEGRKGIDYLEITDNTLTLPAHGDWADEKACILLQKEHKEFIYQALTDVHSFSIESDLFASLIPTSHSHLPCKLITRQFISCC